MEALVLPERSFATRIGVERSEFVPEFKPEFRAAALAPGPDTGGTGGLAFCAGGGLPGPVGLVAGEAAPGAGGIGVPPGANGDGV
jgi:hypothetical protein